MVVNSVVTTRARREYWKSGLHTRTNCRLCSESHKRTGPTEARANRVATLLISGNWYIRVRTATLRQKLLAGIAKLEQATCLDDTSDLGLEALPVGTRGRFNADKRPTC